MLFEVLKAHHAQGFDAGGRQVDLRRFARAECFQPTTRTNAPAIAGFDSRKSKLRSRRGQVIAAGRAEGEEILRRTDANSMHAGIVIAAMAGSIAEIAGEWVETARH